MDVPDRVPQHVHLGRAATTPPSAARHRHDEVRFIICRQLHIADIGFPCPGLQEPL
ncbi:MAG: hypothetical protein MZV64_17585 [Ignavibacteriales bacterium]|nr:hypothetical protein [Ignavibacteriales bacterium]